MTLTPNFGYELPDVGADLDTWGTILNSNWTQVDGDMQASTDAIASLQAQIDALAAALIQQQIPIGGYIISNVATNPGDASQLNYGTWVADSEGRAIVGVGDNGESIWTNGQTGGAETHARTVAEMPIHAHDSGSYSAASAGNHNHSISYGTRTRDGTNNKVSDLDQNNPESKNTSNAGAHTHTITGTSGDAGADNAHNNIQPSKARYVWRRTA